MGRENNQPHSGKALTNESKYPYIVELAVEASELDAELSRQIIGFHKSRQIELQHGRIMLGRPNLLSLVLFRFDDGPRLP